jgi:tRNA A-37 threonylcarbamoyl transferase component Bud32
MASLSTSETSEGTYVSRYLPWNKWDSPAEPTSSFGITRVENEKEADRDLKEMFVTHGKVEDTSYGLFPAVEVGKVEGDNIKERLSDLSVSDSESVGESLGGLMGDLHMNEYAHGDAKLANFIYEDRDIASIDHEFWEDNAGLDDCLRDLKMVRSDAATLDTFQEFMEGFEDGYRKEVETEGEGYKRSLPDYTEELTRFFDSEPDGEEIGYGRVRLSEQLGPGRGETGFLKSFRNLQENGYTDESLL